MNPLRTDGSSGADTYSDGGASPMLAPPGF